MRSSHLTWGTFLALSATVLTVGAVGMVFITRGAERTYVQMQGAANKRQAVRLAELLEAELQAGRPPHLVRERLQQSLLDAPFDPGAFTCLLDEEGTVLSHPDPRAVGTSIAKTALRHLDGKLEGTVDAKNQRGSAGILGGPGPIQRAQLVFQEPVESQPWLVSVHTDLGLLHVRARDFARSMVLMLLPMGAVVVLLGTFAARGVARRYERRIEAENEKLEIRVADRTSKLSQTIEELRAAHSTLLASEKMALIGQLIASLAHEMNNPLAIIIGRAQLAMARRDGNDSSAATQSAAGEPSAALKEIHAAGLRCSNLVRNLLTYARQDPPERTPEDLNALVSRTCGLIRGEMKRSGVTLEVELAPGVPSVLVDAVQIEQVILNLLNNARQAIEATGKQSVIRVVTARAEGGARIHVIDQGPGLPPSIQEHLFEPFHTTKPVGVGTGLGLSICKGFVEANGGSISVRSTGPQGTCFEIFLPRAETAERSRAA